MRSVVVLLLVLAGCDRTGGSSVEPSELPTSEPHTGTTDPGVDCRDVDADGDGVNACDDCDDDEPLRYPGAPEVCDGIDDDCDGLLAEGEEDLDGDGEADCAACDQAGYWQPLRGLEGDDRYEALVGLLEPQWCSSYSAATDFMFVELDKDLATGTVECVYTGRTIAVGSDKPDPNEFNTEHTWPQSLGADAIPAKCDLHHLYPTDSLANGTRGNHPFGEVTGAIDWEEGGSMLGSGSGGTVFEPRDSHKGNVARSMLYFAHRYGYTLSQTEIALFKAWDDLDPVDDDELARTFAIAGRQIVANPFVTCPELVDEL